jgi:hypothetical protein
VSIGAHLPSIFGASDVHFQARARRGCACSLQTESAGGIEMAKYGKAASKRVESAVRRKKKGTLKSSSGQKVTSRKQAIAIGLSEARAKGGKVPRKGSAKKR